MAKGWKFSALTGGGATALDSVSVADLTTGDIVVVFSGGVRYWYQYDSTATAAETSPDIIRPDDYSTGGNWELQGSLSLFATMPSGVELTGQIVGFDCSASTDTEHDVSVAAGACMDSTNASTIKTTGAVVKRIDATWAAGTGNGGLLNGSVAANTVYHFYALLKDSDNSVDFGWLADGDTLATYLPAGYSKYRWLRIHKSDASSNICQTTQNGDYINHHKASDWVVSSGITTTFAAVDHSSFLPVARIGLIMYGARDASVSAESIYASDDGGTSVSFQVASPASTTSDSSASAWGLRSTQKSGYFPFLSTREFRTESGTLDLLIHGMKLRR